MWVVCRLLENRYRDLDLVQELVQALVQALVRGHLGCYWNYTFGGVNEPCICKYYKSQ